MAPHYEVFYSLETTIRRVVESQLQDADPEWWDHCVPEKLKTDVTSRRSRELDAGVTPRSDNPIDFLTFGELSVVIISNWDVFGAVFTNKKAVENVMSSLNTLRNPVAHCAPLAPDEVVRLHLTVKDWFRLSG